MIRTLLCLWLLLSAAEAFPVQQPSPRVTTARTASRRDIFNSAVAAAAAILAAPKATHALNYDEVQDLLGTSANEEYKPRTSTSTGRPMYLTEPTEEFKEDEQKASAFKRQQIEEKKNFLAVLDRVETDPDDSKVLAGTLNDLQRLIRARGGLPMGVTKDDLIRKCRRRKAKRFWPTQVEIAYIDLVNEIRYQQSPNKEKDTENPL